MASPGNQHCANCIGTLSFPIADIRVIRLRPGHDMPLVNRFEYTLRSIWNPCCPLWVTELRPFCVAWATGPIMEKWRHPLNRKYIKYQKAAREGPHHCHIGNMHRKFGEVRVCVSEIRLHKIHVPLFPALPCTRRLSWFVRTSFILQFPHPSLWLRELWINKMRFSNKHPSIIFIYS